MLTATKLIHPYMKYCDILKSQGLLLLYIVSVQGLIITQINFSNDGKKKEVIFNSSKNK